MIPMTFSMIFFSLVLIYILGNALEGMQETGIIFNEEVAYYNELDDNYHGMFDHVIFDEEYSGVFRVTQVLSKEEGIKGVEDGTYETFVSAVTKNKQNDIFIYSVNHLSPIKSIVSTFAETSNFIINAYEHGEQWDESYKNNVLKRELSSKGIPVGIDYYSVQILLQILVFAGIVGVFSVLEDYEKNTYVRLKSSPISGICITIARLMANITYLFILSSVIVGFSIIIFNANWHGNPIIIATTILIHATIGIGLGMLAATITKSTGVSIGIVIMAQIIWSKLSGAFGPEPSTGLFAKMSPNVHAKNIIYATIYDGSSRLILESLAALMIIVSIILGLFFLVESKTLRYKTAKEEK